MQTDVYFKKTVQTKMKILSFIHPHVVPALYEFLTNVEHKMWNFKEVSTVVLSISGAQNNIVWTEKNTETFLEIYSSMFHKRKKAIQFEGW